MIMIIIIHASIYRVLQKRWERLACFQIIRRSHFVVPTCIFILHSQIQSQCLGRMTQYMTFFLFIKIIRYLSNDVTVESPYLVEMPIVAWPRLMTSSTTATAVLLRSLLAQLVAPSVDNHFGKTKNKQFSFCMPCNLFFGHFHSKQTQ